MSTRACAASTIAAPKAIEGTGRPDAYYLPGTKTRVPSVTTITGRFKNASALLAWANREGLEGRTLNEARDAAADAGHIAHQWIQDTIHGRPLTEYSFTDEATLERASNALAAFHSWASEVDLRILATETPIVSERFRFGGTLDAVGYVHGVLSLLDWKTGNGVYAEHVQQQAAYRELMREQSERLGEGGELVPEQAVLIRLDKETGTPTAKVLDSDALDLGWQYFSVIRGLYELDKDVEKIVRRRRAA